MVSSNNRDSSNELLSKYPDFLSRADLVSAGIFPSHGAAYACQKAGKGPPYIKLGRKVIYPKKEIERWLLDSFRGGRLD